MPAFYAFVIPAEYISFFGPLGLLIGAALGVGGTIITQRWRNRHEVNLKQIDFQQKEIERQQSREDAFLKQKSDAADVIIKKMSLRLQYFFLMEQFFEGILKARTVEDLVVNNDRVFNSDMEAIFSRQKEEQLQSIQSFHTFFDEEIILCEEEAKIKLRDNNYEGLCGACYRTMDAVIDLSDGLQNAAHDTPAEFERVSTALGENTQQLCGLAQTLLELTRQYIQGERNSIMLIRKQKKLVTPF